MRKISKYKKQENDENRIYDVSPDSRNTFTCKNQGRIYI